MTYHIWYKEPKGQDFKIWMAWGSADLEDKLIDLKLHDKSVYLILGEGKAISGRTGDEMLNIKQTIACLHCGGIDAHRHDCKGGYGL